MFKISIVIFSAILLGEFYPEVSSASLKIDADDFWDGDIASSFEGGDGSKNDPFQIKTGAQLAFLAQQVNSNKDNGYQGKYFKLIADIDLGGHAWTPIGLTGWHDEDSNLFMGYFDGNNNKITNLRINDRSKYIVISRIRGRDYGSVLIGLFGGIGKHARISNLEIKDAKVDITNKPFSDVSFDFNGGILAGYNGRGWILNCSVSGSINIDNAYFCPSNTSDGVGGLVGYNTGKILDCSAKVDIISPTTAGGLVAVNGNYGMNLVSGIISNCHASGNIKGTGDLGGLVGTDDYGDIFNCAATGNVKSNTSQSAGGLIGSTGGGGWVLKCTASGSVDIDGVGAEYGDAERIVGGSYNYGGLVGFLFSGTVEDCAAKGNVKAHIKGAVYIVSVGGLVGFANIGTEIFNCTASGNVEGNDVTGGLVGSVSVYKSESKILNCQATGKITGTGEFVGQIIGVREDYEFRESRPSAITLE
jgi:hypothetical protein